MIEAKDLRIGNWVYLSSHKKDIGEVHLGFNNTNLDLFEPIELTEEWLLKFGFKIVVKNAEKNGVLICYNIKEKTYDFVLRDSFYNKKFTVSKLRHVHSLQNLYYELTKKELTIK